MNLTENIVKSISDTLKGYYPTIPVSWEQVKQQDNKFLIKSLPSFHIVTQNATRELSSLYGTKRGNETFASRYNATLSVQIIYLQDEEKESNYREQVEIYETVIYDLLNLKLRDYSTVINNTNGDCIYNDKAMTITIDYDYQVLVKFDDFPLQEKLDVEEYIDKKGV